MQAVKEIAGHDIDPHSFLSGAQFSTKRPPAPEAPPLFQRRRAKGVLDRVVHEPARLRIMMMLSGVDTADFKFLITTLGLTKGNLSCHVERLEKSGYVEVEKGYVGKIPHTNYRLTQSGRDALENYWASVDEIRALRC